MGLSAGSHLGPYEILSQIGVGGMGEVYKARDTRLNRVVAVKILAPGFFAKQDVRTPVKIAISVLVVTQLLNILLVPWMAHAGLALAISLAPG